MNWKEQEKWGEQLGSMAVDQVKKGVCLDEGVGNGERGKLTH